MIINILNTLLSYYLPPTMLVALLSVLLKSSPVLLIKKIA